jgi:hypothetical protein
MAISLEELKHCKWTQAGQLPLEFTGLNSFGSQLLGWENGNSPEISPGLCEEIGTVRAWTTTKSAAAGVPSSVSRAFTPGAVTLINGDVCSVGDWVVWVESVGRTKTSRTGCVAEIVQLAGSTAQQAGKADFLLLSRTIIGDGHDIYKMRRLEPIADESPCSDKGKCIPILFQKLANNLGRISSALSISNTTVQIINARAAGHGLL